MKPSLSTSNKYICAIYRFHKLLEYLPLCICFPYPFIVFGLFLKFILIVQLA